MDKIGTEGTSLSQVHHIGVVVKDINKAIEHFQALGIGPFEALPKQAGDSTVKEAIHRGKPYTGKTIIRLAQVGPLKIELLQHVSGESINKEFLQSRGEGISHLGFLVDDLDSQIDNLTGKGFDPIFLVRHSHGGGGAFFDTSEVGGFLIELYQPPPTK
ncbi:VOC family protein [Chloroflexota bacterium]